MEPAPTTLARAHRLRAVWDYLPAFRAVAETEHLPTAAQAMHVTASSLSRAIRMAEHHAGVQLFERAGRRMHLNPAGHALLAAVRAAMRVVDESMDTLADPALVGNVVVAAGSELSSWLAAPALALLRAAEPGLTGEIVTMPADPAAALRRGDVDVLIATAIPAGEAMEVEPLLSTRWALYGARENRRRPRELLLVAGTPSPAQRTRAVAAKVADAATAAAVCRHGFVAWLPAPLARAAGLERVPGSRAELVTIHAIYRTPVARHARTEAMLGALRAAARAV